MQNRAKEGSTKANMHTMQLAAEDYGVQNDGSYASAIDATHILPGLPQAGAGFKNPFDATTGSGNAWELRGSFAGPPTAKAGITSYKDSVNTNYNVKGYGKSAALTLVLTAGQ